MSAFPIAVKTQSISSLPILQPSVSVSMSNVVPLKPEQAYDDLIQEAAGMHHLDPALIRAVIRTESAIDPLDPATT